MPGPRVTTARYTTSSPPTGSTRAAICRKSRKSGLQVLCSPIHSVKEPYFPFMIPMKFFLPGFHDYRSKNFIPSGEAYGMALLGRDKGTVGSYSGERAFFCSSLPNKTAWSASSPPFSITIRPNTYSDSVAELPRHVQGIAHLVG